MDSSGFARWAASPPEIGDLAGAAAGLRAFVARGEDMLAGLPARPVRTPAQQRQVDAVRRSCREARRRFLRAHADAVYDELTGGRRDRPRLDELVYVAAKVFPGLVPTRAQIEEERAVDQSAKEGHEIDQGLLAGALLDSPAAGAHLSETMRTPTPRALSRLADFQATGRAELNTVHLARAGGVAHVTLRNTEFLNAEDEVLLDDLETAVDLSLLDEQVRVGVLRGGVMTHPRYAGRRVFCSGINLTRLYRGRISLVDFLLRRELGLLAKVRTGLAFDGGADPERPYAGDKPWLAAVDGHAIGGGMQLLLVFDHVVAASDAFFSLPAAREGIVPGAANLRLGRQLGPRLARRIIVGGHRLHATDPEARLLCDDIVEPDAVDGAVAAATAQLDNPAVLANKAMLRLGEESPDEFRRYLAAFAVTQAYRLYSADVIDNLERTWIRRSTP